MVVQLLQAWEDNNMVVQKQTNDKTMSMGVHAPMAGQIKARTQVKAKHAFRIAELWRSKGHAVGATNVGICALRCQEEGTLHQRKAYGFKFEQKIAT